MLNLDPQTRVGDLVKHQPQAMRYFERVGIDYCCGGHRTLAEACALAGALCAVGAALSAGSFAALLAWRALGGFFLAGIYPVGMKIASQWYRQGLGVPADAARAMTYLEKACTGGDARDTAPAPVAALNR